MAFLCHLSEDETFVDYMCNFVRINSKHDHERLVFIFDASRVLSACAPIQLRRTLNTVGYALVAASP